MSKFSRQQADSLLSELVKNGRIRRVARGIYDYPAYSNLLQKDLGPNMDQVAHAYARKNNWRIFPSGGVALNFLGLSSQVPATYLYLSDGRSCEYEIMGIKLRFKKSALKDIGFKHRESALIVQALKSLGKAHLTKQVLDKISEKIDPNHREKILKDTQGTTDWIYEAIKEIYRSDITGG